MIRIDGLTKRCGAIRALDRVSFEVRPGEVLGVIDRARVRSAAVADQRPRGGSSCAHLSAAKTDSTSCFKDYVVSLK